MSSPPGHPALFHYPARAGLRRVVPKSRIYTASNLSRRVRDQITANVAQIIWKFKLSPEILKIPASPGVSEIQIFSLKLKSSFTGDNLPEDILRCIDRAIGFPIFFELRAHSENDDNPGRVRVIAAYKRPNEAEKGKWVISDYFASEWLPDNTARSPLPVALDMARLYEQMLIQLIPTPCRPGEAMAELVERQGRIAVKQRECRRLEARVNREKQYNRKVELNHQLRDLRADLNELTQ